MSAPTSSVPSSSAEDLGLHLEGHAKESYENGEHSDFDLLNDDDSDIDLFETFDAVGDTAKEARARPAKVQILFRCLRIILYKYFC